MTSGYTRSDSSLGVQTPEGIEYVLYPAGLPVRACAWAVDGVIQWTVIIIVLIISSIQEWPFGQWSVLIFIFLLDWFYHFFFEVFFRGQSPGKKMFGIKVIRGDGSPISPGSSFLRNLLRFADTFMFLYLIAFICMLVSPSFKRLGDWVADTLVVYTANARSPGRFTSPVLRRPDMPWLAAVPKVFLPRNLGYDEKHAVLSFARRYPLLGEARANEIANIWVAKLAQDIPDIAPNEQGSEPSASDIILGIAHSLGG